MYRMQRLFRLIAAVTSAAFLLPASTLASAPPSSGLVYRVQDVFLVGFQDSADALVALAGPPAELSCQGLGWEPFAIDIQGVDKPSGATTFLMAGEIPFWVYQAPSFDALCEASLGGGSVTLLAAGDAIFTFNDNDFFLTGPSRDSYGARAIGTLTGADGTVYQFRAVLRGQVEPSDGDDCVCRVIVEDILLTPAG